MNTVGELERACLHVQELEETVASKTRTVRELGGNWASNAK